MANNDEATLASIKVNKRELKKSLLWIFGGLAILMIFDII